jgi:hypothetical protein
VIKRKRKRDGEKDVNGGGDKRRGVDDTTTQGFRPNRQTASREEGEVLESQALEEFIRRECCFCY